MKTEFMRYGCCGLAGFLCGAFIPAPYWFIAAGLAGIIISHLFNIYERRA